MGRFKSGLFLGGILGASLAWLGVTKSGREIRDAVIAHAAALFSDLKSDILKHPRVQEITRDEYTEKVESAVERYMQDHALTAKLEPLIHTVVVKQWKKLQKEIKHLSGNGQKKKS